MRFTIDDEWCGAKDYDVSVALAMEVLVRRRDEPAKGNFIGQRRMPILFEDIRERDAVRSIDFYVRALNAHKLRGPSSACDELGNSLICLDPSKVCQSEHLHDSFRGYTSAYGYVVPASVRLNIS